VGMTATADPQGTRRFTADEVWRMVEIGLLGEDEPYELLDGQLRHVSPQDPPHAGAVRRLTAILSRAYGERYDVGVQLPIGGIDDSIPEPDLSVTGPRDINAAHPRADEVLLLIEVAHTSLRDDLDKARIYAVAGCPEYWIVDIGGQRVMTHRGPRSDGSWQDVHDVPRDGELTLPVVGTRIAVQAIMPRPQSQGAPAQS
jgi:Uma2 family endonuclease